MNASRNTGSSMIEVLITIVILMIGLLGLAGLQGRAFTSQLEAYQRSQALILLRDMESRINANRNNAALYLTTTVVPVGLGTVSGVAAPPCPFVATPTGNAIADNDLCEWHAALLGAAEKDTGANNVGAMIGARGCIAQSGVPVAGAASEYLVAVAWQGLNSTAALTNGPAAACGSGQYGSDDKRRLVVLPVSIGCLAC